MVFEKIEGILTKLSSFSYRNFYVNPLFAIRKNPKHIIIVIYLHKVKLNSVRVSSSPTD